jgi:hypothetical protein
MPAIDLRSIPTIPHVHSATTTSTVNKCQIVQIPTNIQGVGLIIHNRDKASKSLRVSFAPDLVQDGSAPTMYFTIGDPLELRLDHSAASGFQPATQIAFFSDSASVNFELTFRS